MRARTRRAAWLREEADAAIAAGRPDVASFLLKRAIHNLDPDAPSSAPTRPMGQVRPPG